MPAFLALSSRGRVPVLESGEFVLPDSIAILAYLDRKYPEAPLFGATPEERARIWQLVSEGEGDLRGSCDDLLHPLFFLGQDETNPDVKTAALEVHRELKRLELLLERSPFLVGSRDGGRLRLFSRCSLGRQSDGAVPVDPAPSRAASVRRNVSTHAAVGGAD